MKIFHLCMQWMLYLNLVLSAVLEILVYQKYRKVFFPLIAFKKDGTAVLIKSLSDEGNYIGIDKGLKSEVQTFDKSEFKEIFSEYFIIAKGIKQA